MEQKKKIGRPKGKGERVTLAVEPALFERFKAWAASQPVPKGREKLRPQDALRHFVRVGVEAEAIVANFGALQAKLDRLPQHFHATVLNAAHQFADGLIEASRNMTSDDIARSKAFADEWAAASKVPDDRDNEGASNEQRSGGVLV